MLFLNLLNSDGVHAGPSIVALLAATFLDGYVSVLVGHFLFENLKSELVERTINLSVIDFDILIELVLIVEKLDTDFEKSDGHFDLPFVMLTFLRVFVWALLLFELDETHQSLVTIFFSNPLIRGWKVIVALYLVFFGLIPPVLNTILRTEYSAFINQAP